MNKKPILKEGIFWILVFLILFTPTLCDFFIFLNKNKKIIKNGLWGTLVFIVLLVVVPYIITGTVLTHHMYIRRVLLFVYEISMIYISVLRIVPRVIEKLGVLRCDLRENYENELWGTTAASLTFSLIIAMVIYAVW